MTRMDAPPVIRIICPGCGAQLLPTAAACQQCGRVTGDSAATASKGALKRLLDRPWVIVVLMLHVGLLGIPVYWQTKYSLAARVFMVIASIVYTVGAVAFIVLTLRWLLQLATGG